MSNFEVAYIPIGVPTFELVSAKEEFDKSVSMLGSLTDNLKAPDEMLLSIDKLKSFLDTINPSLIVLQNITFANSAYASEVVKRFDCPLILWTLREPEVDGGRLRLNSLTGAFSAGNTIRQFKDRPFEYVYGSPNEEKVKKSIGTVIRGAEIKNDLKSLTIAAIGHTPQGFGFGRALDGELLKTFGVNLESVEVRELMDMARSYSLEDIEEELEQANKMIRGLEQTPEQNRLDFARLFKAYKEFVKVRGIGALSSRCWPDYFTEYGTPVCTVLSLLNDLGVAASCETDTYGALSMYIGMKLSKNPVFFGDPVLLNEEDNTISFWHCGMAPSTLANEETGACVGVHCNRKIGPTLEFACKPYNDVTIFRVGKDSQGNFRFFISKGESLDIPRQFCGTNIVVRAKGSAEELIIKGVKDGWEPHFAIIYGDVSAELMALGNMLDLDICEY